MSARLPTSFYIKLSAVCFAIGAAVEGFMLNTGFYATVTAKEAERWEEGELERKQFRTQVALKLKEQGVPVPPELQPYLELHAKK
ncbi:hypothetical protein QJQ45_009288 [Haematococcus lacustris]|nr:hypothetical protein QJQ45_009288 [Haematococcus lacustris]